MSLCIPAFASRRAIITKEVLRGLDVSTGETTGKAKSEPRARDNTSENTDGNRDHVEKFRVRHRE